MRKLVLTAAFLGAASTAFAGGMNDAKMSKDVVAKEMSTSAFTTSDLIVPLLILGVVVLAAGNR